MWTSAEGNPLFLAELLRHVDTALPTVDPRTLPQSVEVGVARRLARMDAGTRQLLAVASIIGPEFSLETVARTGEVPPDRLLAAADEAVAAEIIEPDGRAQPLPLRPRGGPPRGRATGWRPIGASTSTAGWPRSWRSSPGGRRRPPGAAGLPRRRRLAGGRLGYRRRPRRPGRRPGPGPLAFDEAAEWYGAGLGLLVGHSRDAAQLKCRLLVSLGDAHDRAGEQVRARHSFLEAVAIARTLGDPALLSLAESALSRSPWPVPVHKPILSKIPVGTQNQHPFLMPEPPPVKLLPMGELLATSSAPDVPPAKPPRRSTPRVAAEQEMRAAAHRASTAAAEPEASSPTHPPSPRVRPRPGRADAPPPAPRPVPDQGRRQAAVKAAPRPSPRSERQPSRRRPAAGRGRQSPQNGRGAGPDHRPPVATGAPAARPWSISPRRRRSGGPYTPDDLSELWADPEPASAPMGWTEAPWDDDDHTPASRRTTSRLSALRARHSRPWGPEDLDERLKASDQIVAIAEATDDGDLAMEGYAWRIADRLEMGRLSQADEDIAAFTNLANAIGDPLYRRDASAYAAMRAIMEGRFDDARSALLDVRALAERAGDTKETPGGRDQRYWMALEWGSDEAVEEVEASLKALPVGRAWAAQVALLLARTRRYDEASEWLDTISEHVVSARPFDGEWMQMAACALEAGALVRDPGSPPSCSPCSSPTPTGWSCSPGDGCASAPPPASPAWPPPPAATGSWPSATSTSPSPSTASWRPIRPWPTARPSGAGPCWPRAAGRQQAGREPPGAGPRPGRRARHAAPGRRHPGQAGREMTSSMRLADVSSSTAR